jgi:23S rRNA (adenine2503-C2)-methyltransferase
MKIELTPTSVKKTPGADYVAREQLFAELFPDEPGYRWKQLEQAICSLSNVTSFADFTSLSKEMRSTLESEMPFLSLKLELLQTSKNLDTCKALFSSSFGKFESVLMKNMRGSWTICVSSQIGCGMGCTFCATGKMGFIANLSYDLIIDQYRFWNYFVQKNKKYAGRISNIVFMGMGEPLANYPQVKKAVRTLLEYTDLGPTKITVSSVGVLPILNKILNDEEFPRVRIAISLHSADPITRKAIVPSSSPQFLDELREWAVNYLDAFGNRSHHITFEYVMLKDTNDSKEAAQKLRHYVKSISKNIKVNLIPYNTVDETHDRSERAVIEKFANVLRDGQIKVTIRKNMGNDISAACGQLATLS